MQKSNQSKKIQAIPEQQQENAPKVDDVPKLAHDQQAGYKLLNKLKTEYVEHRSWGIFSYKTFNIPVIQVIRNFEPDYKQENISFANRMQEMPLGIDFGNVFGALMSTISLESMGQNCLYTVVTQVMLENNITKEDLAQYRLYYMSNRVHADKQNLHQFTHSNM